MHRKLFTVVLWITILTMFFMLPYGSLPNPAARAASQPLANQALAAMPMPFAAPPSIAPAPPFEAPPDPLAALRDLSHADYLRLYRGQPTWPHPIETGVRTIEPELPSAQISAAAEVVPMHNLPHAALLPDEHPELTRQRRLEEERLHALAQLLTAPGVEKTSLAEPPAAGDLPKPPLTPAPTPGLGSEPSIASTTFLSREGIDSASIPAEASSAPIIQGRVTSALDGSGLAGVNIYVSDEWCDNVLVFTQTGPEGYYSEDYNYDPSGLKLMFSPSSSDLVHVFEWYENQPACETSTTFYPSDGQVLTVNAVLEVGGQVSGRVTAAATGLPVADAIITAVNATTKSWSASAVSDTQGDYTIYNLPAGQYLVFFQVPPITGNNLINEWYDNQPDSTTASPVSVTSGLVTPGIDAALESGAMISGRLTRASDGAALEEIYVAVYVDEMSGAVGATSTDSDGNYAIFQLAAGNYKVYFYSLSEWGGTGEYVNEWYQDKTSFATADVLSLSAGQSLTGIDGVLSSNNTISGRVTDSVTGEPIANVLVNAYGNDNNGYGWSTTQPDGVYTISGLIADSYRLRFGPPANSSYYAIWYSNKLTSETADLVPVGLEQAVTGIDQPLSEGGKITGRVTDSLSGEPVSGVQACARSDTEWLAGNGCGMSDAEGFYTITGLIPETYRIQFFPPQNEFYPTIWYHSKTSYETADPIPVALGQAVTDIDQLLVRGGTISGTVTAAATGLPQPEVYVAAYYADSGDFIVDTYTDAGGAYALGALPSQPVKIFFQPNQNYSPGLQSEWYQDKRSQAEADPLTVALGVVTPGIDAALESPTSISGHIARSTDNAPLANITVSAVTADTYDWLSNAISDSDGNYTLANLPAGTYKVYFQGGNDYTFEWYDNQPDWEVATPLTVTLGQALTGIDAVMSPVAKITGTVTNSATGNPLPYIEVLAYDPARNYYPASESTDQNGNYTLTGLPAGTYQVEFHASNTTIYETLIVSEWYNNRSTQSEADPLTLSEGQTLSGIDAVLEAGVLIGGQVTRASDGTPLAGVYVGLVTSDTQDWIFSTNTDAEGNYVFRNIASGSYFLYFTHPDYIQEWYQDALILNDADAVWLAPGDQLTGLNVALEKGGKVSGTLISEFNGAPLEGVEIYAVNKNSDWFYAGTTNAEGFYVSNPLPADSYRLRFNPQWGTDFTTEHILEWYKDQPTESTADWVTVMDNQVTGGLDAALTRGGIIRGVVTDETTGLPLENIEVSAYIPDWDMRSATTDEIGAYAIKGLPAGNAAIAFETYRNPQYIPERYNNHPILGTHDPVPVSLNQVVDGINASLAKGVRLTGQVISDADGLPLANVQAMPYDANGDIWGYYWTDNQGKWSSWALPDGEYTLRYWIYADDTWTSSRTREHLGEYASDAGLLQNGDPVMLAVSQGIESLDLGIEGLELGSKVSGTVTGEGSIPLADVRVEACPRYFFAWNDCRITQTAADGSYTLSGMYAGRYSLSFDTTDSPNETTRLFANQRYNGLPWYAEGDDLRVPSGATLAHIDATLQTGGFIRGVVTAFDTLAPLPSVEVDFYTSDGQYAGYAETNLAGEYISPALPPGEYKVQLFPYGQSGMYGWEWYNNQYSLDDATPLSVTASHTLNNIDAVLTPTGVTASGFIQGKVTNMHTGLPVPNTTVEVWSLNSPYYWGAMYGAQTDSDGNYSLQVTGGSYVLRFLPPMGQGLAYEWFDNRSSAGEANPILISGGSTFTANAMLSFGASIIGTVTDAATGEPLPNARFSVIDTDGSVTRSGITDETGQYVTPALPPGTFYLMVESSRHLSQFFTGAEDLSSATPILVEQTDLTGMDIALTPAAILAGRVSAIDGSEPVFSSLKLIDSTGESGWFSNQDYLSHRGEFSLKLLPGDYRIYAMPESPYNQEYQGAYFDQAYSLAEAIVLHLTAGEIKNQVNLSLDSSGGKINGRTTTSGGTNTEFSSVSIYDTDGEQVAVAYADWEGYYTSPLLAAGDYRLLFVPWSMGMDYGTWLPEYYNDRYSLETAIPVSVLSGQTTTGINVAYANGYYQFTQPGDAKAEGFGFYDITVALDAPSALDVSLSVTFGGTASPGEDYIPFGSEIIIPAGETTAALRLDLLEDSLYEVDETVTLELLSNNYGLRGEQTTFLLTLIDDETPVVLPAPLLESASPEQSRNHVPVELTITGANFVPGSLVSLSSGSDLFYPPVSYLHSGELRVSLPVGFAPGVYDLTVTNPDEQSATLNAAYLSLSPVDDDLLGNDYEMWTQPTSVYAGTTVSLGQVVSRIGGALTLTNVDVSFYLGDPASGGILIGSSSVASLAPNSQGSTPGIPWNTPVAGAYSLYAVLDPANEVTEVNETNNILSRAVQVLEMPVEAPDLTPPVVQSIAANNGATITTQATVNLTVFASDADPGSVARVKFIEYVYNEGVDMWQEGKASNWLTYIPGANYPYTLLPGAGARYLQAWVADAAGNVSLLPQQTWINYAPASSTLLAGQSHYYLFELAQDEPFTLTITPAEGDPDLYVWAPDFYVRPPWVSISANEPDWVSFVAPLDGMYVARVFGYTNAGYALSATSSAAPKHASLDAVTYLDKTILSDPGLKPDSIPSEQRTVPAPEAGSVTFYVFLPVVTRD